MIKRSYDLRFTIYDLRFANCKLLLVIFFMAVSLLFSYEIYAIDDKGWSVSLQQRLIEDGFDKDGVEKLYKRPEVFFETKGVSLYFVHNEGRLDYEQFKEEILIQRARNFIVEHKAIFKKAEKEYGVDKEVITAILLVETRLGTYYGKKSVLNILSTMAALDDTSVKKMLWNEISGSTKLTQKEYEKKADEKSAWAYNELRAFFIYTAREKLNPLKIYGSYAGAMGIAQFIPTSILKFALDGNDDGHINLFNFSDAIISVANYLSAYGWYPGIDNKKAYEVIYQYNHSKYYVNTVLDIAGMLK